MANKPAIIDVFPEFCVDLSNININSLLCAILNGKSSHVIGETEYLNLTKPLFYPCCEIAKMNKFFTKKWTLHSPFLIKDTEIFDHIMDSFFIFLSDKMDSTPLLFVIKEVNITYHHNVVRFNHVMLFILNLYT